MSNRKRTFGTFGTFDVTEHVIDLRNAKVARYGPSCRFAYVTCKLYADQTNRHAVYALDFCDMSAFVQRAYDELELVCSFDADDVTHYNDRKVYVFHPTPSSVEDQYMGLNYVLVDRWRQFCESLELRLVRPELVMIA